MALTDILAAAGGGQFFAAAAKATGLSESDAKKAIGRFAPEIAASLKAKAAADPDAFDALLDLLEEGGDLDDVGALTDAEAVADGAAILDDLYGSATSAGQALGIANAAETKAAAISATGVLAALAASQPQTLTSDTQQAAADSGSSGGGFLSILLAALLKGLMQGVQRQLAPRRRRRRRYAYSSRRRSTRRRTRRPGLDDVFRDILGSRR